MPYNTSPICLAEVIQKIEKARKNPPNSKTSRDSRPAISAGIGRSHQIKFLPTASRLVSFDGTVAGLSLIAHRRLATMLGAFFFDVSEILVEYDTVLARERDETFA